VVDSRLQTPPDAHIFIAGRQVWIYAAHRDDESAEKAAALEARGATVTYLPNADGKVDLPALLKDLAARGVNELHVESGHKLNGSMLREGCVDELLVYLAPKLIGSGLDIASHIHAGGPLTSLAGVVPLEFKSVDLLGPDLRVVARIAGRDAF
jgi:diaminohydroxyphosphoribosylaminopyrimidine deaminase/5-amino-6-(5-phosphoribosylamino)uracil reductase